MIQLVENLPSQNSTLIDTSVVIFFFFVDEDGTAPRVCGAAIGARWKLYQSISNNRWYERVEAEITTL